MSALAPKADIPILSGLTGSPTATFLIIPEKNHDDARVRHVHDCADHGDSEAWQAAAADWDDDPPEPEPAPTGTLAPEEGKALVEQNEQACANRPMAEPDDSNGSDALLEFGDSEDGEEVVAEWGDEAPARFELMNRRIDVLGKTMTAEGAQWLAEIFEALPTSARADIYRVLGRR